MIIYSAYAGPLRRVALGDVVLSPVSRDFFEAAVARLEDDDLPVCAMLLDREPLDSIARALRTNEAEVSWRAQRIVGRLAPGSAPAPTNWR